MSDGYANPGQPTVRHGFPNSPLRRWFETHLVTSFFILTFLVSWGFWLPMIFVGRDVGLLRIAVTFGPLLSALAVSFGYGGFKAVRKLLSQFRIWRVNSVWYFFCFFSTALVVFAALGIYLAADGHQLVFKDPRRLYLILPVLLYVLLFRIAEIITSLIFFSRLEYILPRSRRINNKLHGSIEVFPSA